MAGREGHNGGTKKRKVVRDSKGNVVKDSKGNAVTSNDYSKTKTAATKKKAPAKTKTPSKPKATKKKVASKPKAKVASSGPSKRPNNKPKTKAKSSGPSKRPNNKPKTTSKNKTYVSSGRGTTGNGAFPGGPRGRVQRTKAAISKGGDSSNLSPKYQRRVSKSIKRDAKRGVTNLSKPKRVGKRSDRRGNR